MVSLHDAGALARRRTQEGSQHDLEGRKVLTTAFYRVEDLQAVFS
jgi:hypothetical protein